jgi:hypothetical protein
MEQEPQRLVDGKACMEAALLYASRGWSPLPLCPPDHVGVGRHHVAICKSEGKAPLIKWGEHQLRIATESEIRQWWQSWPNANVGVAMGPGGLVGIDTDGPAGDEALRQMIEGGWIRTLEFKTPGGGLRHLYVCRADAMLSPKFQALAKKEEVRLLGRGAQTVAPPSRHPRGGIYQWNTSVF